MKNGIASLLVCVGLLLVASKADGQTNTGVNNSELQGSYAFNFSGIRGNGITSSVFGAVGRFTADGAGNVTSGELDTNGVGTGAALVAQPFTATYSIGTDHRGVMTLSFSAGGSAKLAFAMTAGGNAEFIEFDASGGSGTIGSGTMEKSDTTAFSTAGITGDYAFGAAGSDNANNRAAIEGRFTSNGAGTFTGATGDVNAYGTDFVMNFTAADYTVSDTATGRGTMHFAFTFGGTPDNMNFVFYIVNSGKLFVMESDTVTSATPLLTGAVVRQQTPAGGFSSASLNGKMVIYLTGLSVCSNGSSGVPKAVAGVVTADGNGALSIDFDENYCRAPRTVTGMAGTYAVAGNGRTTMAVGGYSLVAYLANLNQVFLFVSDSNVLFGVGEPQAAGSFTNSALKGPFAGYATNPQSFGVTVFSGEFAADGASPTGKMTGSEDTGDPSGPVSGAAFQGTYSIASSPTNGRGTLTVTSGTGGNAVIYMISATKFVVVSSNDPNPAVLLFEQAPTSAPTVSLSSVLLSPTSVTGGAQSSTGTVTLSAAAPSGGAQVSLSSSNTAAAQVPASVTVAAGATTATFTVSSSAVSASTTVTISAAYGGTTRTASLMVNPAPPSVTLASLTLSPTSVTGGVQSSTGTVTLSGAAPSGGAQVTLSSSNTAVAQMPASVTVAAGATTATFTVRTSAVSASTTVTISAAYAGTTKTASLTVNPLPLPTVTSLTVSPSSVVGGLQSSTGTVTLSAPAPPSGARITLSSSNSAASVPSSLTIPAGAKGATFAVRTSIVLISTSSTIAASYNNSTRTANLSILL